MDGGSWLSHSPSPRAQQQHPNATEKQQQQDTACTLFVGDLPENTSAATLKAIFEGVTEVSKTTEACQDLFWHYPCILLWSNNRQAYRLILPMQMHLKSRAQ